MAENNKRNLINETAAIYAANAMASNPTPLFLTGTPAKIVRASMANTNLLSSDGDLFVGTGDTYTETIDGIEYTYAKIAKKNQSDLFINELASESTNVGLSASVGKFIDDRLHISTAGTQGASIIMGNGAASNGADAVVIGTSAYVDDDADDSIAIGKSAKVGDKNAIQLGMGENTATNTFQVGNYQMLDLSTGKIPMDRINQARGTTLELGGDAGTILGDTVCGISAKTTFPGGSATAVGYSAEASSQGVSVGAEAYCKGTSNVAIGYKAILGIKDGSASIEKCVAIGAEAKIENDSYMSNAIQLGAGTNSTGGFQVWNYQLMNISGIIPSERRPVYKCTVQYPSSYSPPTSSTSPSVDIYYFDWYSSVYSDLDKIPSNTRLAVTGYQETMSYAVGGTTSVYKPCCGRISKVGSSLSLRVFNYSGSEVSGIDRSLIKFSSEAI